METKKFNGGYYPADLLPKWEEGSKKDGFQSIWHWLRWLAQRRINFLDNERKVEHE